MVHAETFQVCLCMYVAQITPLCALNKVHPKSEIRKSAPLLSELNQQVFKSQRENKLLATCPIEWGLCVDIFSKNTRLPTPCIYCILLGSFSGSPLAAIMPTHLCVRVSHNYFS